MENALLIFALALSTPTFSQGPVDGFFKGKNVIDIALSAGYEYGSQYIGAQGPFDYERNIVAIGLFAEYGITDKFDIIANLPVINFQLQDGGIFLKYNTLSFKVKNRNITLFPAVGFSTPLSDYNTESSQAIGQKATQFHGKIVGQMTLPAGMYLQAQTGYNYALDPVPSAYTISTKLCKSQGDWYFDLWYEYQKGLGNITYQGPIAVTSFRTLTVDTQKIGGVIYKTLKNGYGAFINGSKILTGLDTYNSVSVFVGVVKKLNFNK
jgi:hypothetical protein